MDWVYYAFDFIGSARSLRLFFSNVVWFFSIPGFSFKKCTFVFVVGVETENQIMRMILLESAQTHSSRIRSNPVTFVSSTSVMDSVLCKWPMRAVAGDSSLQSEWSVLIHTPCFHRLSCLPNIRGKFELYKIDWIMSGNGTRCWWGALSNLWEAFRDRGARTVIKSFVWSDWGERKNVIRHWPDSLELVWPKPTWI